MKRRGINASHPMKCPDISLTAAFSLINFYEKTRFT
jgi:hypothetical protein